MSAALDPLAAVYKASGDPLRLEILRVLRRETFGVLELCQLFDSKQSGMSHHLKVLARAGLVESQREGNAIFYRRPLRHSDESLAGLAVARLFEVVDRLALSAERQARVAEIRLQRSAQSQAFFARYAERFREQQELIADFDQYAGPVEALIDARLGGTQRARALEIGPGEGAFLPILAQRFTQVTGVDNSSEMLALATAAVRRQGLENVTLARGEAGAIAELKHDAELADRFDLVVANMVLHHLPNPADIFPDVAALLAPGGRFLVSELSSHDQNWVRPNCGDLWLGFGADELITWAQEAGLKAAEPTFIGLRNGFQIQIWEFSLGKR
jgi:2-polyprenyl-3-methyl-5-hydroxy-6-metoxy-1,4-benzoquinol methylase/DNA-binding transcriptional ArsR family regulator